MGFLINISGILYIFPQKTPDPPCFSVSKRQRSNDVPRSGLDSLAMPLAAASSKEFQTSGSHVSSHGSAMGIDDIDETTKKITEKST